MPAHDPPAKGEFIPYWVDTPTGAFPSFQPKVYVGLSVQSRKSVRTRVENYAFLIDTGMHVTLVPIEFARSHNVVGYDSAKPIVELFPSSLAGVLLGRWGSLTIRVGGTEQPIPCFFYSEQQPRRPFWLRWWIRLTKGKEKQKQRQRPKDPPALQLPLLGRSGVLNTSVYSTIFDRKTVGMSDTPFL